MAVSEEVVAVGRTGLTSVDDRVVGVGVTIVAAGDKDRLGEATTWAEAADAFHHINAATQAATDATPMIDTSARRP